jgi:hypothetical protein
MWRSIKCSQKTLYFESLFHRAAKALQPLFARHPEMEDAHFQSDNASLPKPEALKKALLLWKVNALGFLV